MDAIGYTSVSQNKSVYNPEQRRIILEKLISEGKQLHFDGFAQNITRETVFIRGHIYQKNASARYQVESHWHKPLRDEEYIRLRNDRPFKFSGRITEKMPIYNETMSRWELTLTDIQLVK